MKSRASLEKIERFQYLRVIRSILSLALVSSSLIVAGCGGSEDSATKRDPKDRPPSKPAPLSNKHLATDSLGAVLNIALISIENAIETGLKDKDATGLLVLKKCQVATPTVSDTARSVSVITTRGACNNAPGGGLWDGRETIEMTLKDKVLTSLTAPFSNVIEIEQSNKNLYTIKRKVRLTPTTLSASPNVFDLESMFVITVQTKEANNKVRTSTFTMEVYGLVQISQSTGLLTGIAISDAYVEMQRQDKTANRDSFSKLELKPVAEGILPIKCGRYVGNMTFTQTSRVSTNNDVFIYKGEIAFAETSVRNTKEAQLTTKVAACKKGYATIQADLYDAATKTLNNLVAKKANEET
ncbi:MAG: hypothetical protein AABZ31_12445, partial [Bdellovibrionota bacterium]